MKNIAIVVLFFVLPLLCSCSSGEVKLSENYIENFEIPGISPIEINIRNDQSLIYVWTPQSEYEKLKNKFPDIEVSEKAELSEKGENWTAENFQYVVTAENGEPRNYFVKIDTIVPRTYSFDYWNISEGKSVYYIPSNFRWSSGNPGIALAYSFLPDKDNTNPESFPTRRTKDGYKGNAVLMETVTGGEVFGRNIRLFSGNFFIFFFIVSKATGSADELLEAIEIGYIYPAKPKSIKGYYKYTEGPGKFINKSGQEETRPDSCSMIVNFYRSDLPNGKDTTLTVKSIDDSDLVIARSRWYDCTGTDGKFKEFEIKLENYTAEPDFENHRYKLAISFAASKDGDYYSGKIGSKLIIDEMEFIDY
jgi:hypothetical protein